MIARWTQHLTWKHLAIAVAAITFAVYAPFLGNGFVSLDDNYLIYENPAVQKITGATLRHVFTSYDPQLYIPLTFVSYQLTWAVAGNSPFAFHLVNLLLHVGNAVLMLWILSRITGKKEAAAICALLFAIHPLQTEAVLWAAARKDVLSWFFGLLSIAAYLRYRRDRASGSWFLSILLFLFALLSKVSVITLPFLLLLIDWYEKRTFDRRLLLEKVPYLGLCVVFGIVAVIGKAQVLQSSSALLSLYLSMKSTLFYLWKIAWPLHFSVIYPQPSVAPGVLLSFSLLLGLLGILGLLGFLLARRRMTAVAFAIAWYVIVLLPSYSTFWKNGFLYFASDRYVYMASMGPFLLHALGIAWMADQWKKGTAIPLIAGGVLAAVFIPFTLAQGRVWRDSEALYRNVLRGYPDSVMARINLGFELDQQGKRDEAVVEYRKAVEVAPWNSLAYFNLAAAAGKQGKIDEALGYYRTIVANLRAEELTSEQELKRFYWLNDKFRELAHPEDAIVLLEKLARLAPGFASPHEKLGTAYVDLGRAKDAQRELEEAERRGSRTVEVYYHLAEYYSDQNRTADLIRALQTAHALAPQNDNVVRELLRLGVR